MNDNKFTEDFREEELFRRFLEKQNNHDVKIDTVDSRTDEPHQEQTGSEWNSEYEYDDVIESFADFLPREAVFPDDDKPHSIWYKIKRIFKYASKKENAKHLACILIPGFLLLLLVFNILTPSASVSQKENRALAQFPEISLKSITDGSFMKGFEDFISDQFVFRNFFVSTKRQSEILIGKKENHQILMCDDGYLIENTAELTHANIVPNLNAVEDLASVKRYNITLAVLPTAYEIMSDSLPAHAYTDVYHDFYSVVKNNIKSKNIKIADVSPTLKENTDEYQYYRTDHHQTAHGSYYTYAALGEHLGYTPHPAENFEIEKVATGFYGTMWSNSGFADSEADELFRYTLKEPYKHKVSFPADGKETDSLYSEEMLKGKDKYAYYLDGNHALTVIKSTCPSKKRLAIIKDSYAHSIAPFLANHYSEIYMIDLRYYNDDILEYLYNCNIKDVLILYNQNTFMTDTNLSKITTFVNSSPYNVVPEVSYGIVPELDEVDNSYFDDAVFIGDSLTIGIQNFAGFNSTFLCMGGLSTKNLETDPLPNGKTVMESIDELDKMGKIYIMLGTNESVYEKPDEFIERYSKFIDNIRERFPNVIVYVQSIMPVSKEFENATELKNSMITTHNEYLLKMAKEKQCYYIDLHSFFADEDGTLPHEAGGDGVHLSPENYRVLAQYLKTHAADPVGVTKIGSSESGMFGGGGKYDCTKIGEAVLKEIKFKDTLSKVSDALIVSNYSLNKEKVCSAALYMGGGSTAEEIAVIELKDEDYAKEVVSLAQKRIDNKKKDFENYMPAEMTKLNNPVIVRKGNIVAVCIADNVTKEQIEKCINRAEN